MTHSYCYLGVASDCDSRGTLRLRPSKGSRLEPARAGVRCLGFLGLLRQEELEGGALAGLAAHLYGAAVGLGDLAGDGEPQSRATRRARGIGPVEALEYER